MFDKLEDLLVRLEEILSELNEPGVANDPARFQKLMKEQSELQPIVDAYKEYKACQQTVEESLMMLDEESDEEMREMLKEELSDAKSRIEELETELKILLLPKDPNDSKNVIVEIRAGHLCLSPGRFTGSLFPFFCCFAIFLSTQYSFWNTSLGTDTMQTIPSTIPKATFIAPIPFAAAIAN